MRRRKERQRGGRKSPFYERATSRTVQEIRFLIEPAIRQQGFISLGLRDVSDMYIKTGHPIAGSIFYCEFSSPGLARDAYQLFPQLAVLGPSRIAVYVRDGETRVATLLPSGIGRILPPPRLSAETAKYYRKVALDYDLRVKRAFAALCRA